MALVQTSGKIRTSGSGDVSVTMPSNFTAGNSAIASGCRYEGAITSLTINGTTSTVTTQSNSGISGVWIRHVASLTGGSNSATLDTPGASDYNTFSIEEHSGLDTASIVDSTATPATGNSSAPSVTVNPSATGNLIYGCWNSETGSNNLGISQPGSYTAAWTENDSNTYQGGSGAYRTAAATGSQAATWSTGLAVNWRAVGAVFKAASGGTGYTLTADSGSFTLTGAAAGLLAGRKLAADAGSFTLTGAAANTLFGRKLTADAASFVLTGTDAALKAGRLLSAEAGSFALSGTDAALTYEQAGSYTLTADSGSFALAGGDVGLIAARVLSAEAGSFALTGSDAALLFGRRLQADAAAFSLVGQDATLTYEPVSGAYTLTAEPGVFTLTGWQAGLIHAAANSEQSDGATPYRRYYYGPEEEEEEKKPAPTPEPVIEAPSIEEIAQASPATPPALPRVVQSIAEIGQKTVEQERLNHEQQRAERIRKRRIEEEILLLL